MAIDPAPFRGVLPLPISALKSSRLVLGNPANRNRAVPLTFEQFRFGFANAVSEDEEKDNTVPWSIANASFKKQERNEGVTEIVEIPNRGHALTIDSGWREVADTALGFVRRFI